MLKANSTNDVASCSKEDDTITSKLDSGDIGSSSNTKLLSLSDLERHDVDNKAPSTKGKESPVSHCTINETLPPAIENRKTENANTKDTDECDVPNFSMELADVLCSQDNVQDSIPCRKKATDNETSIQTSSPSSNMNFLERKETKKPPKETELETYTLQEKSKKKTPLKYTVTEFVCIALSHLCVVLKLTIEGVIKLV